MAGPRARAGNQALKDAQVAGLSFLGGEGDLGKHLPAAPRTVPGRFRLEEARTVLAWDELDAKGRPPRRVPDALDDFLGLSRGRPEDILSFARRYGPLYLCGHQIPACHAIDRERAALQGPLDAAVRGAALRQELDPDQLLVPGEYSPARFDGCPPTRREPLSVWWRYRDRIEAVVQIAARLHRGEPGPSDAWKVLLSGPGIGAAIQRLAHERTAGDVVRERYGVTVKVRGLMLEAGVTIGFDWSAERPEITVDGVGALGAIVRELPFAIAKQNGFEICTACGLPYTPPRRGSKYCLNPECKAESGRAASRRSAQRRRERERQERGIPRGNGGG